MSISYKKRIVNQNDYVIADRLKARRLMLGLSQSEMSKILEISIMQIQQYEKSFDSLLNDRFHNNLIVITENK